MLELKLRSLIELSNWLLLIRLEDIIALLRPFDVLHLQHYSIEHCQVIAIADAFIISILFRTSFRDTQTELWQK